MHVFVTGATGWVGLTVVKDLIAAGHRVTGLARDPAKAPLLAATGATVLNGTLDDIAILKRGAGEADAVIHTAFNHDFSKFAANGEQDRRSIELFGEVLTGTSKPLLVTSGLAMLAQGRLATEEDVPAAHPGVPRKSEATARALAARGIRAATVRLSPSVHGVGDHGFITILAKLAREKGVSAYIGEGANRWAGVHRIDAARLYRLALETGVTEQAYHAVADEGVAFKEIATAIGRQLGLPVESRGPEHFGWFGAFAGMDMSASSAKTRQVLGWEPTQPGLLADIDQPAYYGN